MLPLYYNYLLKETGRKNEAITGLNNSIKRYQIQPFKRKYEDPPSAISDYRLLLLMPCSVKIRKHWNI